MIIYNIYVDKSYSNLCNKRYLIIYTNKKYLWLYLDICIHTYIGDLDNNLILHFLKIKKYEI